MNTAELYALPPEEFTAARDAAAKQAKADGDPAAAKELKALRRPSVAAWLVNRLAGEQGELLEQLLALGPALAEAQSSGNADELRALGRQRRELVEAVAGAAVSAADRPVAGPVRDEVVSTVEAALADPSSAQAVRSGRLVRALTYAGFGEVDLSDAVAAGAPPAPVPPTSRARAPKGADQAAASKKADQAAAAKEAEAAARAASAAAERTAHEAAGRLDDAVRTAERAERVATTAADALEQADQQHRQAEEALARAEQARRAASRHAERAEAAAQTAREAVRVAQDHAEAARKELDRIRRG